MTSHPEVILASASPRRAEILRQVGVNFQLAPVSVDETPLPTESPVQYVERLACDKALAGWHKQSCAIAKRLPVIGADTSVVFAEKIMGKPTGEADAVRMLSLLSGKTHRVLTAVALFGGDQCHSSLSETEVTFREISAAEAHRYWATGEPCDKAGSYGIQGLGAVFVDRIKGSYSGVVGLPVAETCSLLQQFDISWWNK